MKCLTLSWPLDLGAQVKEHVDLPGSNIVYDFHGDPMNSELTIVMEGNQFMVIPEMLDAFYRFLGKSIEVFYVTLPPPRFLPVLEGRALAIGNLILNLKPQIVMGPPEFMKRLLAKGMVKEPRTFMTNKGVVLVYPRGNPKAIGSPSDLMRPDIKIGISNPKTEVNSFNSYIKALSHISGIIEKIESQGIYSSVIHHREIPAFIYHGVVDVAPLYRHFALYYENPRFFKESFFEHLEFPEGEKETSSYQVAIVDEWKGHEYARAWWEFLQTNETRKIYERYGF